jgi:hypothetical protein
MGEDPDFYLNADPDPTSQTNADSSRSGSWLGFAVTRSLSKENSL